MDSGDVQFLSVDDVIQIHADTIAVEGGGDGISSSGLLEAAVMMPRQTFDGALLHDGHAEITAAYLFHICQNHPFVDGNKRAATLAALVYLDSNGVERLPEPDALEAVTLAVARGEMSKSALTDWMKSSISSTQAKPDTPESEPARD